MHVFEVKTGKWRTVEIQVEERDIPQCRMGHLMLLRPPKNDQSFLNQEVLYIHGGMSGNEFFDDFYRLQLKRVSRCRFVISLIA